MSRTFCLLGSALVMLCVTVGICYLVQEETVVTNQSGKEITGKISKLPEEGGQAPAVRSSAVAPAASAVALNTDAGSKESAAPAAASSAKVSTGRDSAQSAQKPVVKPAKPAPSAPVPPKTEEVKPAPAAPAGNSASAPQVEPALPTPEASPAPAAASSAPSSLSSEAPSSANVPAAAESAPLPAEQPEAPAGDMQDSQGAQGAAEPALPVDGNGAQQAQAQAAEEGGAPQAVEPEDAFVREITSARFAMRGSLIKLVLQGNAALVGHASVLREPDRVVLDLAGKWKIELPRVPSNRLIRAVRMGYHEDMTRLVFDMKTMGEVTLVPLNRNALELRIQ